MAQKHSNPIVFPTKLANGLQLPLDTASYGRMTPP